MTGKRDTSDTGVKIAVCAEVFSPNLGDGIIAECLEWLFKQVNPSIRVVFVDFSCRPGHSMALATQASLLRQLHRMLTRFPRYRSSAIMLAWYMGRRRAHAARWSKSISDCNLVLIGGGQVLMDNDLAFPMKIHELVRLARRWNRRIVFYACGVGGSWSTVGLQLLRGSLLDPHVLSISVRDRQSRDTLDTLFPDRALRCSVSIDPAICAAEAYGVRANPNASVIGLGISAAAGLRRHARAAKAAFAAPALERFWFDLACRLQRENRPFVLFSNGQSDDYAFAARIAEQVSASGLVDRPVLLERPWQPRTLVEQLAQFRAIVSHRLHANIVAYSLGIPSVGLVWDEKVKCFGQISGRDRYFLTPAEANVDLTYDRLCEALAEGVDGVLLADLKARALQSINDLALTARVIQAGA